MSLTMKPVLAREREARLKDECWRSMFSNPAVAAATRGNKGEQRKRSTNTTTASKEGPMKLRHGLDRVSGDGRRMREGLKTMTKTTTKMQSNPQVSLTNPRNHAENYPTNTSRILQKYLPNCSQRAPKRHPKVTLGEVLGPPGCPDRPVLANSL